MTLSLRMKRQTTVRGRSFPIRIAISMLGLGWVLSLTNPVAAQTTSSEVKPGKTRTLFYGREPVKNQNSTTTWESSAPIPTTWPSNPEVVPVPTNWPSLPESTATSAPKKSVPVPTGPPGLVPVGPKGIQPSAGSKTGAMQLPGIPSGQSYTPPKTPEFVPLPPVSKEKTAEVLIIPKTNIPSPDALKPLPLLPQPGPDTPPFLADPQPQPGIPQPTETGFKGQDGQNQTAAQVTQGLGMFKDESGGKSYKIKFNPPGPEAMFRLESDAALKERMRQEVRTYEKLEGLIFPDEPVLSKEYYKGRFWPIMKECVEPSYVIYRRPYFEQINVERYGWEVGIVTPFLCAGKFYWDCFFLPYHMGTEPFRHYESNAGYCLPGDPTPFLLYPPRLSATGLLNQGAAVATGFAVFP